MSESPRDQWAAANRDSDRNMVSRDEFFGRLASNEATGWNVIPVCLGKPLTEDDE